jgi:hypothetical protein
VADPADEPTMAVAHGDPALARHLRQSLELLRDRSDNNDFRRLVDDVLHGRANLRDVYTSPAFAAGLNPHVEEFARRYEQLSPEQRQELAEQGRQALDAEREGRETQPTDG